MSWVKEGNILELQKLATDGDGRWLVGAKKYPAHIWRVPFSERSGYRVDRPTNHATPFSSSSCSTAAPHSVDGRDPRTLFE